MASRRGLSNQERLALDMVNVTSTGTVLAVPMYVYALFASITDSSASGKFSIGNSTASGDLVKESTRLDFKIGLPGLSAGVLNSNEVKFNPPLYIQNGLYWNVSTGISSVSVTYLPAQ